MANGKPGRPLSLDGTKAARFFAALKDGPPFIKIAAARARIPMATVDGWLYDDALSHHPIVQDFRLETAAIRAEYMNKLLGEIQVLETGKQPEVLRQKQWILTCLDREMFDKSRAPKEKAVDKRNSAAAPAKPEEVRAAADDLQTPELDHPNQTH